MREEGSAVVQCEVESERSEQLYINRSGLIRSSVQCPVSLSTLSLSANSPEWAESSQQSMDGNFLFLSLEIWRTGW